MGTLIYVFYLAYGVVIFDASFISNFHALPQIYFLLVVIFLDGRLRHGNDSGGFTQVINPTGGRIRNTHINLASEPFLNRRQGLTVFKLLVS